MQIMGDRHEFDTDAMEYIFAKTSWMNSSSLHITLRPIFIYRMCSLSSWKFSPKLKELQSNYIYLFTHLEHEAIGAKKL